MIKFLIVTAAAFLFSFSLPPKSIYTVRMKDIDGRVIELEKFRGKKMVFIILSGKETDSAINDLSSFNSKYKDSTIVIGVLSAEDGFVEADKDSVKKVFKTKCPDVILTERMHTRKTSADQSELMQWFTHVDQNLHFDNDITGAGRKFFIDEAGELYGSLGPQALLSSALIHRVMSRPSKAKGANQNAEQSLHQN
jgi:glutathione peroxidase